MSEEQFVQVAHGIMWLTTAKLEAIPHVAALVAERDALKEVAEKLHKWLLFYYTAMACSEATASDMKEPFPYVDHMPQGLLEPWKQLQNVLGKEGAEVVEAYTPWWDDLRTEREAVLLIASGVCTCPQMVAQAVLKVGREER